MSTVKLTINDMEIEVERGTSILQAAQQLGIEVPHFCYHERLYFENTDSQYSNW